MSSTWVPLMDRTLRDLASEQGQKVYPGSLCTISNEPQDLRSYVASLDDVTGIIHVTFRRSSFTLKEILTPTGLAPSGNPLWVVEFSKGEISVIPRDIGVGHSTEAPLFSPSVFHPKCQKTGLYRVALPAPTLYPKNPGAANDLNRAKEGEIIDSSNINYINTPENSHPEHFSFLYSSNNLEPNYDSPVWTVGEAVTSAESSKNAAGSSHSTKGSAMREPNNRRDIDEESLTIEGAQSAITEVPENEAHGFVENSSAPIRDPAARDPVTCLPEDADIEFLVAIVHEVNFEYGRLWRQGICYRSCLFGVDEPKIMEMAVNQVRSHRQDVPDNIESLTQQYNKAYANAWEKGNPQQKADWSSTTDFAEVQRMAVLNLKWDRFAREVEEHREHMFQQISLEEATSAKDWLMEAFGERNLFLADNLTGDHNSVYEPEDGQPAEQIEESTDDGNAMSESEPERHHINFLGTWFHQKSNTCPSVSLFAAVTASRQRPVSNRISAKAVMKSQAAKRIDPFTFDGDITAIDPDCRGSALREMAIGRTSIVYERQGTWGYDTFDEDEDVPRSPEGPYESIYSQDAYGNYRNYSGLQLPYYMGSGEDANIVVNDDGRPHVCPNQKVKNERGWRNAKNCGPTNLRFNMTADGASSWAEPQSVDFYEYLVNEHGEQPRSKIRDEDGASEAETDVDGDAREAHTPIRYRDSEPEPPATAHLPRSDASSDPAASVIHGKSADELMDELTLELADDDEKWQPSSASSLSSDEEAVSPVTPTSSDLPALLIHGKSADELLDELTLELADDDEE
ncbi:hypothetical protein ACLMJK_003511 [Lecanora helva]